MSAGWPFNLLPCPLALCLLLQVRKETKEAAQQQRNREIALLIAK